MSSTAICAKRKVVAVLTARKLTLGEFGEGRGETSLHQPARGGHNADKPSRQPGAPTPWRVQRDPRSTRTHQMAGTAAGGGRAVETSASGAAALNASAEALPGDLRACGRGRRAPERTKAETITGHNGLNPTCTSTLAPYSLRSSQLWTASAEYERRQVHAASPAEETNRGHQGRSPLLWR